MKGRRGGAAVAALALSSAGGAHAQTVAPAPAPAFRAIADARLRYDQLDQEGRGSSVDTVKLRLLVGGEAQLAARLRGLGEVELIEALYDNQDDRPSDLRLSSEALDVNRAQLSWTGLPDTEVTIGRQTIVINDGRFIGNGETRQNDQTFDAVKIVNRSFAPVTLTYAYLDAALRPARQVTTAARLDNDSHLLQAEVETALGRLSTYGYLLDFPQVPAQSSASFGVRLTGRRLVGEGLHAVYTAEYAHQTDYGANPARFGLRYTHLETGLQSQDWSVTGSLEWLDGDGERGFLVPLSSEYGFHGWSDAIFNAPPDGLLDINLKATARLSRVPIGDGLQLTAAAYALSDADGAEPFGRELDVSATTRLTPRLTLDARAALFGGRGGYADRTTIRVAARWKL
jgi:hypothetical protein